jgi:hypothetical protein
MEHDYTKADIETRFDNALGKTLAEIDKTNYFESIKGIKKKTGIAGDIVEQSILEYPPDTKQEPDISISGVK